MDINFQYISQEDRERARPGKAGPQGEYARRTGPKRKRILVRQRRRKEDITIASTYAPTRAYRRNAMRSAPLCLAYVRQSLPAPFACRASRAPTGSWINTGAHFACISCVCRVSLPIRAWPPSVWLARCVYFPWRPNYCRANIPPAAVCSFSVKLDTAVGRSYGFFYSFVLNAVDLLGNEFSDKYFQMQL